ncbi:MAG: SlyX family protein [Gammaproteobacteria bacterium]
MTGTSHSADERLAELESRLAWQEDALEQLNTVISRQWDTIDQLLRRAEALEDRLGELEAEKGGPPVAPPPHY